MAWQSVLLDEREGLSALLYPVLKFGPWYYVSLMANVYLLSLLLLILSFEADTAIPLPSTG